MTGSRPAPAVTPRSAFYWSSGQDGTLRIARCQTCGFWLHPPRPVCPRCRGRDVAPEPVSGRGTVWSWTITRHRLAPDLQPPYVIAEVELVEQPGLRLLSTVVGDDDLAVGQSVSVAFEPVGDVYVPVFVP